MELKGKKIVICEDVPLIRHFLVSCLEEFGADNIKSFPNPVPAISFIKKSSELDLILTDIGMPEMNGIEFIDWLQECGYDNIPIIIISGSIDQEVLDRANRYALTYLDKPFELEELELKIRKI